MPPRSKSPWLDLHCHNQSPSIRRVRRWKMSHQKFCRAQNTTIRQNHWQVPFCLSPTKNADFHKSYFFEARGFTSAGFLFISPADFGKTVIPLVK